MTESDVWATEPRDAVVVAGEGARAYLHSQLSQSVDDLEVGDSRWTLLLQPDGHIDVLARLWCRADDEFVLDTDEGFGDVLEARVRRFMIRVKSEVTRTALIAAVQLGGVHTAAGGVIGWWGSGSVLLDEVSRLPAGSPDAGAAALASARVAAGWPAMGTEILPGERSPAEVGVISVAVNLRKGCYPGQELVERMDSRGARAPRRLCQIDVEQGAAAGDAVVVEGADVGKLTTVAGKLTLGYVKRGVDYGRPVAALARA